MKELEFHRSTRLFLSNSSLSSRTTWTLEIGSWDSNVILPKVWGLERVSSQVGCKGGFSYSSIICVLLALFQGVHCDPSLRRVCVSLLSISPCSLQRRKQQLSGLPVSGSEKAAVAAGGTWESQEECEATRQLEYMLCISRKGVRGIYVCAQAQRAWAGIQHCPDAASTWSPESWAARFIWETIQGCNSTKLCGFFPSSFHLVYNADNLGKQKWCAAVSERILTWQSCQKCDVNRHTYRKLEQNYLE